MFVRLVLKAVAAILAMLLAALPVMACARRGVAMTAAERDCCKRMAEKCGRSGMAESHECCQAQVSPNDFRALKASSSPIGHSLVSVQAQPLVLQPTVAPRFGFVAGIASPPHSPPGLLSSGTTVLRI